MLRPITGVSALFCASLLMTLIQGCDSSPSSGAGETSDAQGDGSSILTAGTQPLEGAVNIDLGYRFNVARGDYVHTNVQGLLFADGWVFKEIPRLHLGDFDVDKSRQDDIGKWGEWQKEGGTLSVRWYDRDGVPGDWNTYENWFMFENPTAGETLEGTYKQLDVSSSSVGSKEFFASGWSVVTFGKDGTFAETSGGSVTVGTSSNATTDANLSLVSGNSDSTKGNYQITDNDIKFVFEDGSKRENSIFFSSSEKKIVFINGVKFIRG